MPRLDISSLSTTTFLAGCLRMDMASTRPTPGQPATLDIATFVVCCVLFCRSWEGSSCFSAVLTVHCAD